MNHIDTSETYKANLKYIQTAMDQPMLEREKEQELAYKWRDQQDEAALHEMIHSYTRLVIALAAKFKHYGLPMGDLIQEGNIGLMEAAKRFDPDRDIRFSTYASWWIRSTIQDYVLRNWSIVRTGTTAAQKSLFFNLRRLRAKIEGQLEESSESMSYTAKELVAKELGVRMTDVDAMEKRLFSGDHSLNNTINSDDGNQTEWQDMMVDDRPNPEDFVVGMKNAETRSKWLYDALSTLPEREQHIIRERNLSDSVVTLEKLGEELGISKERVRQLEARAMEKLKENLITQSEGQIEDIL